MVGDDSPELADLSDPTVDRFSVLPRGETDGLILGGARDEWRLRKVLGDSVGVLGKMGSESLGEGDS